MQPGAEECLSAEFAELFPRMNENLLRAIIGQIAPDNPSREGLHACGVAEVETLECLRVAPRRARNITCVGVRHRLAIHDGVANLRGESVLPHSSLDARTPGIVTREATTPGSPVFRRVARRSAADARRSAVLPTFAPCRAPSPRSSARCGSDAHPNRRRHARRALSARPACGREPTHRTDHRRA